MKTPAVRRGDKWVINGSKCLITNGEYANYYTAYAKTDKEAASRAAITSASSSPAPAKPTM